MPPTARFSDSSTDGPSPGWRRAPPLPPWPPCWRPIIPFSIGPGWKALEIRWEQLAAIALIALVAAGNYRGVRLGGNAQVALTALKLALIGASVIAVMFSRVSIPGDLHTAVTPVPGGFRGFFKALVAALWAYDGWNNAAIVGSEIERPGRNLPRAVIVVYLAANFAYFSVLSSPEGGCRRPRRRGHDAPYRRRSRRVRGRPGAADFDFCDLERISAFRFPRAVRHGAGRLFFFAPPPVSIRVFSLLPPELLYWASGPA